MTTWIVFLFLLTIAAFWGTTRQDADELANTAHARPAAVLVTYHAAASRACNAGCPDGVVPSGSVYVQMPSMFQGNWTQVENIGYRSFAVTGIDPISNLPTHYVVTALQNPANDRGRQINAQVMDWLYTNLRVDLLAYTGTYDAASGRMTNRATLAQVGADGNTLPVRNLVFPTGDGGLGLPTGTPMMITRIPPFP